MDQTVSNNNNFISALVKVRLEWEQAVSGTSLVETHASVGLLLGDIVSLLDLSTEERAVILGEQLTRDIEQL